MSDDDTTNDDTGRSQTSSLEDRRVAICLAAACTALLSLHLGLKFYGGTLSQGLDAVALGLAVAALSPWLARMIDTTKWGGVEFKFRQIGQEVREQRGDLDTLQFLIGHFLGRSELDHLKRLAAGGRFEIDVNVFPDEFKAELRHLRALGFIDNHPGKGIRSLYEHDPRTTKRDVLDYFFITDSGRKFLKLRSSVS